MIRRGRHPGQGPRDPAVPVPCRPLVIRGSVSLSCATTPHSSCFSNLNGIKTDTFQALRLHLSGHYNSHENEWINAEKRVNGLAGSTGDFGMNVSGKGLNFHHRLLSYFFRTSFDD